MRKIILASHGEFSKGLNDSVQMVVGPLAENVAVYSLYPGESASDYAKELEKEILQFPEMEFVIIADIFGASVCSAMIPLTRYGNVKLFTGMNFNMVLELLTTCTEPLTEEDICRLLEVSREGIRQVVLELSEEEEDF